jgi:hypothetical protein
MWRVGGRISADGGQSVGAAFRVRRRQLEPGADPEVTVDRWVGGDRCQ